MSSILLVQPRHIYAPDASEENLGHVYMPTSLLTVAARLLGAGVRVDFCDENLAKSSLRCEALGVNLLGAPYVSRARELLMRLKESTGSDKLILGGQIVSGFSAEEFSQLFGERTVNGNDDSALADALRVNVSSMSPLHRTSLIPAYELLDDAAMQLYLSAEFSFFLSQGCKFSCTFCAAQRTRQNPLTGRYKAVREMYRESEIIEQDLSYLIDRASRLGLNSLSLYLSNLDLFQSIESLEVFVSVLARILDLRPHFSLSIRGLSTTTSFLLAHRFRPSLIERLVELGLYRIGFGVDGGDPTVWTSTRKPHTGASCVQAISITRDVYGITPETLMVFGHSGLDTEASLHSAVAFTKAMLNDYGALPRPHVAKTVVPGNDGWIAPTSRMIVNNLLAWPQGFQSLDFTALPSPLTHPDAAFRELATANFLEVCNLKGTMTQYVLPETHDMDEAKLSEVRRFNERRYDI